MNEDDFGLRLFRQTRSLLADLLDISGAIWIGLYDQGGGLLCSISGEADFLSEPEFFSIDYSPDEDSDLKPVVIQALPERWRTVLKVKFLAKGKLSNHPLRLYLGFLTFPSLSEIEADFQSTLCQLDRIFDELTEIARNRNVNSNI